MRSLSLPKKNNQKSRKIENARKCEVGCMIDVASNDDRSYKFYTSVLLHFCSKDASHSYSSLCLSYKTQNIEISQYIQKSPSKREETRRLYGILLTEMRTLIQKLQ